MCGILGIVARPGRLSHHTVQRALDTIAHRGPDDTGCEAVRVADWEVWLAHRRLSIVDLSDAGHQPMWAEQRGRRAGIVYNGEVYNHRALRGQFEERFQSGTDTEILLRGLLRDGPRFLQQTNGMFSLGLLDEHARTLLLARDRLGKKPLYLYATPELLAFASELKPLMQLGLELTVSEEALAYYRWMGYLPAHYTPFHEITKFPAASYATIRLDREHLSEPVTKLFWDPIAGYSERWRGSYEQAVDEFLGLLDDATMLRLEADVPVGAFLSGGIDSSLIVSSIAALRQEGVSAFTVKPDDPAMDESDVAVETAKLLGVPCEVLTLHESDYQAQFDRISTHYDEPFADFSAIPTLAVSEAARKHVKVVLTGDGGDELFLGYPWLAYPDRLWAYRAAFPTRTLRGASATLLQTSAGVRLVQAAAASMGFNPENAEIKAIILRELLEAEDPLGLYDAFKCFTQRPHLSPRDQRVIQGSTFFSLAQRWYPDYEWKALEHRGLPEIFSAVDLVTYLRDDVLVKVDRATMAFGLEARSPLLDHRIVRFAQSLPADFKIRDGRFKALLRDALERRVPGKLSSRGKTGFGAPFPSEQTLQLPAGPNGTVRWSRHVEAQWRARWLPESSAVNRPRVGFLLNDLGGGGAERVATEIADNLPDYEVIFFLLDGDTRYPTQREVVVLDLPIATAGGKRRKLAMFARAVTRVRELKRQHELDAMLSFTAIPNILNALSRQQERVVLSVHSTDSIHINDSLTGNAFKTVARRVYREADAVIGVSRSVTRDVVESFAVPADKAHVIYNAVWLDKIARARSEPVPDAIESFLQGPSVITAGRLVEAKGQWHLLRAFADLKKSVPEARLAILGEGPLETYLTDLARDLGLRVTGRDPQPDADVAFLGFHDNPFAVMQHACVFAFPSLVEGFGNALLEALACGLPAVSSDCRSGPREILAPSLPEGGAQVRTPQEVEFGMLMPPLDGVRRSAHEPLVEAEQNWSLVLARLLRDEEAREFASRAEVRASEFSITLLAEHWREVLQP